MRHRLIVAFALCVLNARPAVSQADAGVQLMGLTFRNRVGIGAGFDKDARAVRGWAALGAGFVEVGTATPEAQAGNPRLVYCLPSHRSLPGMN